MTKLQPTPSSKKQPFPSQGTLKPGSRPRSTTPRHSTTRAGCHRLRSSFAGQGMKHSFCLVVDGEEKARSNDREELKKAAEQLGAELRFPHFRGKDHGVILVKMESKTLILSMFFKSLVVRIPSRALSFYSGDLSDGRLPEFLLSYSFLFSLNC